MPKLLTKRKAAWIKARNPDVIRGKPLVSSASAEMRYYRALAAKIDAMCIEVEKRLTRALNSEAGREFFAEDGSVSSHTRVVVNTLTKKYDQIFGDLAKPLAKSVVSEAESTASTALHQSLKELSGGLSLGTRTLTGPIKDIMKASITENVGLIKSIAKKYLSGVEGAVMRSITTGNGLQDLVPYLKKHKGITLRRARFIAKDQSKKAFENISGAKMQELGLEEFEWLHVTHTLTPRPQHVAWSGQIFKLSNPPIDDNTGRPTLPGQEPGCGCRKIPVIKFKTA